ncbi:hypothetical protein [Streptomyces sp. RerS4]|uniref:hypothetical protein n=1 Tax=Streptomyces sp. RerS4 TaxID=2942449 RepID=UPI00201BA8A1|nr:hypothetical protein [Streptomyces sp. RerS4]UQW99673.1 hypothetical protein M4D82_03310 [Streptomyces sp. RerS4]
MSRRPRPRPARRRRVPRAGALLAGLLGALLLTLAHCPPHLFGDGHHGHDPGHEHRHGNGRQVHRAGPLFASHHSPAAGTAPQSGSTSAQREGEPRSTPEPAPELPAPAHRGHGPACSAPALVSPAPPESPSPTGSAVLPRTDATRAPPSPAPPPGTDGLLIDRSGRTTLTSVCRWRV